MNNSVSQGLVYIGRRVLRYCLPREIRQQWIFLKFIRLADVNPEIPMGIDMGAMLYLQEFGLLTPEKNKILDIGPQNVYHATSEKIKIFVANQGQSVSDEILDRETDRLVFDSSSG